MDSVSPVTSTVLSSHVITELTPRGARQQHALNMLRSAAIRSRSSRPWAAEAAREGPQSSGKVTLIKNEDRAEQRAKSVDCRMRRVCAELCSTATGLFDLKQHNTDKTLHIPSSCEFRELNLDERGGEGLRVNRQQRYIIRVICGF